MGERKDFTLYFMLLLTDWSIFQVGLVMKSSTFCKSFYWVTEIIQFFFFKVDILNNALFQGYGGADEAKMLQRQLQGTSAKIGVGANRVATAVRFLGQYGYISSHATFEKVFSEDKTEILSNTGQIGAAILDDGMQVILMLFSEACSSILT